MSKHLLLKTLGLAAAMMVAGCEKEPNEPNRNNPSNPSNPQPQPKHNVELVYQTGLQGVEMDSIYKYNSDPTVDTIFMVPDHYNLFSTLTTNQLKTRVNLLRERHNVNPDKVFGKGELQLWNQSVLNNPEIVRFFADTLKYNVTYYNTTKSR